jgi:pyruvate dehydrogenase E2 component (dihydrolipoamide acetyltransferase)
VRRLAESLGVSLASLRGTGSNGRILQEDVERAAAGSAAVSAASAAPEISGGMEQPRLQPWSATRRAIAKKMFDSARGIPHFYIVMDVDARPLQTLRARYKAAGASASINDLIVHAAARVLPRHPAVNANHADDGLLSFAHAHIAVAVATDEGVLAPVLRFADHLQLPELTVALAGLRERVTGRRVGKGELDGASFTVSNLGMYGVREFTSIITAPQCASLAVGAIRSSGDAMMLTLTLSCDHRAIDGATGAAFLRELKDALETV